MAESREKEHLSREKSDASGAGAVKMLSRISVRTLVEFILRGGDLDARRKSFDPEAALLGAKMHRKIQKSQKDGYESEVFFRRDTVFDEVTVRVEGRADGVYTEDDGLTVIDEIKSMYMDVTGLEAPEAVHLAQAKCYAAICADARGLMEIGVRMTYVSLDTEEIRYFSERYSAAELEEWYGDLLRKWYRFAKWEICHKAERDLSMQHLEFPFPYREGQKKLTATVYHSIREGKELFLMAPTGVGKTMSCVFPAVRAIGEGLGERIFYLTAKNETLTAGQEAFSILSERGLDFRTVRITAKEKICPMREVSCNPDDCLYAKGHFDRINDAVYELISGARMIGRDLIMKTAKERQVCPFELTLDVSSWCDAILCDYNYVFDPDASLKRFFANGAQGGYIFLIDEAHNLVDRAREMYSAHLVKEEVLKAKRAAGKTHRRLTKALEKLNRELLVMKHLTEDEPTGILLEKPYRLLSFQEADGVLKSALYASFELQAFYEESEEAALKDKLLDFYFAIRTFTSTAEYLDENYLIMAETDEEEHFRVRLLNVNPASRLTAQIDKGRAAVFFSATLLPLSYYRKLLTTREEPYAVYAPTPFKKERRLLLIARDVSTRYADRTADMLRRIARYISVTAHGRVGNYLAFFPSYRLMRDVFGVYRKEFDAPDTDWVMQHPGMADADREIFLENFYGTPKRSLIGFCVMGGSFSEGLDLTGTKLIGAVIVGAGIPQVSPEREVLKQHFREEGFDYAYRYPGINKVEQAAGRVIRTAEDLGVILLLDNRLLGGTYTRLFPREWSDYIPTDAETAGEEIRAFWDRYF